MTQRVTFISDASPDRALVQLLRERGFDVVIETATVANEQLAAWAPDLLLLEIADASAGIKILKRLRADQELKQTTIVVIAEWGTGQATLALSNGADAFERKPINASQLVVAVEQLLRPSTLVMTAGVTED